MNLKTIILREISQIKTNIIHCNWAIQKNDTNELIYKTEGQRMNLWYQRVKMGGGGIYWEFGIDRYTRNI